MQVLSCRRHSTSTGGLGTGALDGGSARIVLQLLVGVLHRAFDMKSVRLSDELEEKLARAARAMSMSHSEFIRDALARRCDEVLGASLSKRLAHVIGTINSSGGRAVRAGAAFADALAKDRTR
jgi:predicted DNA-binding protein